MPILATYVNPATDTMFVLRDFDICQFEAGAKDTVVWRSREYVFNDYPSFGWVRLNGSFSTGAVVRVYRDRVLFYTTPTIMSKEPVRLPAGKGKRWAFEIESADLITSFAVATTAGELT